MLKHVSYRSSNASLNRPLEFSSRSSAGTPRLERSLSNSSYSSSVGGYSSPENDFNGGVSPYRNCPDNASLTSAISFSSLAYRKNQGSRAYCSTVSLNDQTTVPVKIYLRRLRSDMEYKTVSLTLRTTCKELVTLLLTKFRLRHRDPNLFFVLMEVTVRTPSDGTPVRRQLVLEDNARPAELQQCQPKGEANFSIGVRRGGLIRVHDSILMPGSQYKSLMVAYSTTAEELVQLLLNCYSKKDDPSMFCIHQVCNKTSVERVLSPQESPLKVQASWSKEGSGSWMFVLRQNVFYAFNMRAKLRWRRSLDHSSTEADSDSEDHDTTRASIMSTLSNASCGSSSSGVSSDSASTCSSSGVSSAGSSTPPPKVKLPLTRTTGRILGPQESKQPPRPVPRTLFPTLKKAASTITLTTPEDVDEDEEDSGIVVDHQPSPVKSSSSFEDLPPELPPRSATVSVPVRRPKPEGVKLMSKSTVDLSRLTSPVPAVKSRSFLTLTLKDSPSTPLAASTPQHSFGSRNRSWSQFSSTESPVATPPSTPSKLPSSPGTRASPCNCKTCFYI